MEPQAQIRVIREILDHLDRGTVPEVDATDTNLARAYTDPERASAERDRLFRKHPLVLGFSDRLARPGDYLVERNAPVSTLLVRGDDGRIRAFVNACRHRGAALASGCGNARSFSCPYHAWSYATDGALVAVPDEETFPGLSHEEHGLVELPAEERHGLIFALLDPGGRLDLDGHLGGLDADLSRYGFDRFRFQETRVLRRRMNWKLVSDTFWEAYHLKVLHRRTVGPIFLKNFACFEAFGSCHRLMAIRSSIEGLRAQPEEDWDLLPHATILMNLFPNTVAIMQSDHAEIFQIFPVGDGVGEASVAITILAPDPREGDGPAPEWKRAMDLVVGVLEEDFEVGETIQRSFETGAVETVIYGRTEGALSHFHRSVREALGDG